MNTSLINIRTSLGRRNVAGVTLIELMIGLAVAGIVMAFALPSFRNSAQNAAIRSATMDLVTALNTARAQAVALRSDVIVASVGGAWPQGWIIQYPATSVETDQTFTPPDALQIVEAGAATTVTFNTMGLPNAALAFSICDGRANEIGRLVSVSRSGRVTSENLSPCL